MVNGGQNSEDRWAVSRACNFCTCQSMRTSEAQGKAGQAAIHFVKLRNVQQRQVAHNLIKTASFWKAGCGEVRCTQQTWLQQTATMPHPRLPPDESAGPDTLRPHVNPESAPFIFRTTSFYKPCLSPTSLNFHLLSRGWLEMCAIPAFLISCKSRKVGNRNFVRTPPGGSSQPAG